MHPPRVLRGGCAVQAVAEGAQAPGGAGEERLYRFAPRHAKVKLGIKLAGVHWCSKSLGHAAENTAGYYHTAKHNGYAPIMAMLARHGAHASFTCVEMRDCEHPNEGACGPEDLLELVLDTAAQHGVPVTGENALQRCAPAPVLPAAPRDRSGVRGTADRHAV